MNWPTLPTLPKFDLSDLKALPTIGFALMLGAAMVITAIKVWKIYLFAFHFWPTDPTVAVEIIKGLSVDLWIDSGLIGLVIVALAFGKIRHLSAGNGVVSGSISFDNSPPDQPDPPEDPPH